MENRRIPRPAFTLAGLTKFAGFGQPFQRVKLTADQSFLLGTGPLFDLGLAFAGIRKGIKLLRVEKFYRRI